MKKLFTLISLIVLISLVVACAPAAPTTAPTDVPEARLMFRQPQLRPRSSSPKMNNGPRTMG